MTRAHTLDWPKLVFFHFVIVAGLLSYTADLPMVPAMPGFTAAPAVLIQLHLASELYVDETGH